MTRRNDAWPPPVKDDRDEPPYAEVALWQGRTWTIRICHGAMQWGPEGGPFLYWGTEEGARAKARRLLEKYARQQGIRRTPERIELADGGAGIRRAEELDREKQRALGELRQTPAEAWEREFDDAHSGRGVVPSVVYRIPSAVASATKRLLGRR